MEAINTNNIALFGRKGKPKLDRKLLAFMTEVVVCPGGRLERGHTVQDLLAKTEMLRGQLDETRVNYTQLLEQSEEQNVTWMKTADTLHKVCESYQERLTAAQQERDTTRDTARLKEQAFRSRNWMFVTMAFAAGMLVMAFAGAH